MNTELLKTSPKDIKAFGFIYKITNLINKKVYIGQTTLSPYVRFVRHCLSNEKTMPICHAIKKYGRDNFNIEVLVTCSDRENLNKFEKIIIKKYKTLDNKIGYNISQGGNPVMTEAGRKKLSELHKGKPKSKEHVEKVRQAHLGLKRSTIAKANIKKSATERSGLKIQAINKSSNEIFTFDSIRECGRVLNIFSNNIRRCLKHKNYSCNNFTFELIG